MQIHIYAPNTHIKNFRVIICEFIAKIPFEKKKIFFEKQNTYRRKNRNIKKFISHATHFNTDLFLRTIHIHANASVIFKINQKIVGIVWHDEKVLNSF